MPYDRQILLQTFMYFFLTLIIIYTEKRGWSGIYYFLGHDWVYSNRYFATTFVSNEIEYFIAFKLYFDVEMPKFSQSMFIPDQHRQTVADTIMMFEVMFCSMTLLSLQVYVSGCCFINKGSFLYQHSFVFAKMRLFQVNCLCL